MRGAGGGWKTMQGVGGVEPFYRDIGGHSCTQARAPQAGKNISYNAETDN